MGLPHKVLRAQSNQKCNEIFVIIYFEFIMTLVSPDEIEKFVREYITEVERLVTGVYLDVKSQGFNSGVPLEFPVARARL